MNRRALTIATHLTVLGLLADLAYFTVRIAAWFFFDGMWIEGLAFTAVGGATVSWFSTIGINRVQASLADEKRR